MSRISVLAQLGGMLLILALATTGCSELADPLKRTTGEVSSEQCLACHMNEARLVATVEPDTSGGGEEPSGEG